jgi:hypothetical protein
LHYRNELLENPASGWYIRSATEARHVSIVVKLEDDLGERSEWVLLHALIPSPEERDFPLLRCIDLYGKTVFNHLQMESFLEEWERLRGRARDDTQRDAWQKIKDLAVACQQDRDLFLRFVGN